MCNIRVGNGYDVHAFVENKDLILGGVKIPYNKGLLGHSDADVLIHSLMDALLGASGMGDIGKLFPDSDDKYKGISSLLLLKEVFNLLSANNWIIINIDNIIICEEPKINPFVNKMKENISKVLNLHIDQISIKATTTEKLGFTGRKEGIACQSVALISRK